MTNEDLEKELDLLASRVDWIMYAVGDCYQAFVHMNILSEIGYKEIVERHNEIVDQIRKLRERS